MIAAATKAPTNDATIGPAAGATLAAMTPLESLLIAFVGGGLAGALVTGLFALIVESRRHAYQDRTRVIDLKRERFATLLREADEHVRILMRQRAFVQDANTPNLPLRKISPEHRGGTFLTIFGEPPARIEGEYWTSRNTSGTLTMDARLPDIAQSFADAEALFVTGTPAD